MVCVSLAEQFQMFFYGNEPSKAAKILATYHRLKCNVPVWLKPMFHLLSAALIVKNLSSRWPTFL